MSSDRVLSWSREEVVSDDIHRRPGYGVQSTRLHPTMNTDAPSFTPYEEFDCDDSIAGSDDGKFSGGSEDDDDNDNDVVDDDDDNSEDCETLLLADNEAADNVYAVAARVVADESYSSPAITATMERIKARDRASLFAMQQDVEHRCIVDILKILEDAQCPDYMLQSVLEWAYNAQSMGFDFIPRAVTRPANVKWMYKALHNSHQRLPFKMAVNLEDHDKPQDIVCFDFTVCLLSLLQDDNLMQSDNLVVNLDDPTSMYMPSDNKYGEAHTGQRYRELFHELIKSTKQLLVPIILYLDGTAIDSKGHIELCPVSFTTSLFSEKVRRHSKAWRLLGFVPDLNRERSAAMNSHANSRKSMAAGRTTRNFHSVMDSISKGMAIAQAGNDPRLKKVPLKIGGKWIVVDIICPLLFVINDGKQGDQLCGRANGHHPSQRRHYRSCDCMVYEDLDNPDVRCSFLTTEMVNNVCRDGDEDDLRKLTLYRVDNTFNRIQMGQNPHGIFMGAVIDVMHTVQHGIIMYAMESFKSFLNAHKLQMLDRMAIHFNLTCRQTIRSSYPRTDFSRGITNLTLVECSEQSGALFLFAALMMQANAERELTSTFHDLKAVLGTMECILCFEAWLEQDTYWEIGDETGEADRAEAAIASMMRLIITFLPRQKADGKQRGNGWKVSKFHEIKHIVRFIVAFGGSRGYNASRPEEHHKAHAKRPGRRSKKNAKTIDEQCARRIADTCIIDIMHDLFHNEAVEVIGATNDPRIVEEGRGTRYHIRSFRNPDDDEQLSFRVGWNTQTRGQISLEDNIALFILQNYGESDLDARGEGSIDCCTEYRKFDANNGGIGGETYISLRCHPNYRGEGNPWYDWAIIETEDDDGISQGRFPSRILCCIPRHVKGGAADETTFDLIVQFCDKPSGRDSILFTEWIFNPTYYIVPATALVRLCFVIMSLEKADGNVVVVVRDKLEWASLFQVAASATYDDPPEPSSQDSEELLSSDGE